MCSYRVASHGKRAICEILNFTVIKLLKKNIASCDLFFNSNEIIFIYLSKRNSQFCYTNIPAEEVTAERPEEHRSTVILSCIKQHFIAF